jgi:transcription termination factor Rho
MAFKATQKKTAPKKTTVKSDAPEKTEKPEKEIVPEVTAPVTEVSAGSFSIEDLIGGPKTSTKPEPVFVPETPAASAPQAVTPPTPAPKTPMVSDIPVPFNQAAPEYGQGGGGYRPNRYGMRRPMGRRDFNPGMRQMNNNSDNGNNFTQDINVPTETVKGILDTMPEGHGFLRPKFTPSDKDVYISQSQIRRFLLRNGDMVEGQARPPKENERYWGLLKVEKINDRSADIAGIRAKFDDLVPVYPNKQLILETGGNPLSTRIIDLISPIGFGQRGLVVSPPKAGKTTILKELAAGISANYPDVHLMAALIGERPEEVTDITRNVHGEVLASNFDESPQEQTRVAEVALDRAKRLVEIGQDVVILLDSITRLARAYNLVVNPSGRTLSGGFDPAALYPAKRFLGAARCVEPQTVPGAVAEAVKEVEKTKCYTVGGSLTVIGTALVDTGSRMDDLIYEEFKGTGNMELHLSRTLQERRVFPAIDVEKSGTRHDELLLGEEPMKKVTTLRHMLSLLTPEERTVMMIDRLSKTKDNTEFLESLSKG